MKVLAQIIKLLARGWRRFKGTDFYRRAFTTKPFPEDSPARTPNVPTIGDETDLEVRRVSGDEFIMVARRGEERLQNLSDRLDTEITTHREKNNPILDADKRPSLSDLHEQEVKNRLEEIHQEIKEAE